MQRSSTYIVGFAGAVCLVCAIFVSSLAVALKDRQAANKVLDRQTKVLTVAGLIEEGAAKAPEEIEALFQQNIKARLVNLNTGQYDQNTTVDGFDQLARSKDPATSKAQPANPAGVARTPDVAMVYQLVKGDEIKALILPIEGKGLWSTLYGFIALGSDTSSIKGITFYQHGETPGLGGEVDNPRWKAQWAGKQAFANGNWDTPKIKVLKGMATPGSLYEIDGLSGATITARGVSSLVQFWLGKEGFGPYLAAVRETGGKS